jgi:hypothetical protein
MRQRPTGPAGLAEPDDRTGRRPRIRLLRGQSPPRSAGSTRVLRRAASSNEAPPWPPARTSARAARRRPIRGLTKAKHPTMQRLKRQRLQNQKIQRSLRQFQPFAQNSPPLLLRQEHSTALTCRSVRGGKSGEERPAISPWFRAFPALLCYVRWGSLGSRLLRFCPKDRSETCYGKQRRFRPTSRTYRRPSYPCLPAA